LLQSNWQQLLQSPSTQALGDAFLQRNRALVFKVPSATVAGEFNYLINPMHPMMKKVRIVDVVPFSFDKRLFIR
jgi:RES domain-containing protein